MGALGARPRPRATPGGRSRRGGPCSVVSCVLARHGCVEKLEAFVVRFLLLLVFAVRHGPETVDGRCGSDRCRDPKPHGEIAVLVVREFITLR